MWRFASASAVGVSPVSRTNSTSITFLLIIFVDFVLAFFFSLPKQWVRG